MGVFIQHTVSSKIELVASASEDIAYNAWQQVMRLGVGFNIGSDFDFDPATTSVVCNFDGFAKVYGRVIYPSSFNYALAVGNFGCMFKKNGVVIGDSLSHFRFSTVSSNRILSVPSLTSIVAVSVGDTITMHANHEEGAGVLVPTFYQAGYERSGFYVERV